MKETFYFSHDFNARNDEKIKRLLMRHGVTGYGIYWAIIEDLYMNANALRTECERIAYELRVDSKVVESVIFDFDLFVFDDENFGSLSVQRRLDERFEKSAKARESANKRWNNANALQTQSDRNAIKESKVKEIKERKVNKGKEITFPFSSDVFKKYWSLWVEFKKDQFNFTYKSNISIQATLNELVKLSNGQEQIAIKIIEQSITKGWQGLFQLKNETNATTNNYSKLAPKVTMQQLDEAFAKRNRDWK